MKDAAQTDRTRRYRERLRANGQTQILLNVPVETVEVLDRLREAHGASSRGDVVASLVSFVQKLQEAGNELKIT